MSNWNYGEKSGVEVHVLQITGWESSQEDVRGSGEPLASMFLQTTDGDLERNFTSTKNVYSRTPSVDRCR